MNDAVQNRRCSSALRAELSRLRPSSHQPRPARRPNPIISNRESLRLEIRLTHTKQTLHHRSNRGKKACFSDRVRAVNRLCDCGAIDLARRNIDRPARRSNLIISNREPIRLEIHLTRRKQTTDHRSNRENKACFSNHNRLGRVANAISFCRTATSTAGKNRNRHPPKV
jgi:hypothetical protein